VGAITVERSADAGVSWAPVAITASSRDGYTEAIDNSAQAEMTYYYRLERDDHSGKTSHYGFVAARHSAPIAGSGGAAGPEPESGDARFGAVVPPRSAGVRAAVDRDASGRLIRTLQNGMMTPARTRSCGTAAVTTDRTLRRACTS